MRYGSLQAAISHHLASIGELDGNGNPIVPVGKIYDTREEYMSATGQDKELQNFLDRSNIHTTKAAKCPLCGKYHNLVEIELYNTDIETKREFDKAISKRGYTVVNTTTNDAQTNFEEDCRKLKSKTVF